MNPIVIYKSEYGTTKKYAEHIAKTLNCKALPLKDAKSAQLDAYDSVIFGGGLYVGKINGADFIAKSFEKLKEKKLAVFTVSLSPAEDAAIFKPSIDASFSTEMQDKIKFFHFHGGMNLHELSFIHRTMMRTLKKVLEKKPHDERTASENGIISVVNEKAVDYFNAGAVEPLIEYIRLSK